MSLGGGAQTPRKLVPPRTVAPVVSSPRRAPSVRELSNQFVERRSIVFTDEPSSAETVPSKSGHLVVCEQGEPLAEVIAANYAYALRAGLCLIPDIGQELSDELFGALSKISTNRVSRSPVYLHRGPFASSHWRPHRSLGQAAAR
jgi:hypothetical protein